MRASYFASILEEPGNEEFVVLPRQFKGGFPLIILRPNVGAQLFEDVDGAEVVPLSSPMGGSLPTSISHVEIFDVSHATDKKWRFRSHPCESVNGGYPAQIGSNGADALFDDE
jgi:hypothetical protein